MFTLKQIVWAKVRGFPWWPAQISKVSVNQGPYKVVFIGQSNHAFLTFKQIKKYQQNYADLSEKKYKGLQPSIEKANQILQKRKSIQINSCKISKQEVIQQKCKKITKKDKRKLRGRKPKSKQIIESPNQQSQESIQDDKQQKVQQQKISIKVQTANKSNSISNLKRKYSKKVSKQQSESQPISMSIQPLQKNIEQQHNQKQQSQMNSQIQHGWSEIQEQVQNNPIQRQKINAIQERLFNIITKLNHGQYFSELNYFKSIKYEELNGDQLSQSKITNMLTYISKKAGELSQKQKITFQSEEKNFIQNLTTSLKGKIVNYLFDTTYYDQYLKLVQRNQHRQNQYQASLILYLRKNYKIKKEFSQIFAQFVSKQISNGNITKEKQLLIDLKEKNAVINPFNNKAALERSAQNLIRIYK